MSRPAKIIEITPPDYGCVTTEHATLRGFVCHNCFGAREFTEQTGRDTVKTIQCNICAGTGKLKAEVSVSWTPDDK